MTDSTRGPDAEESTQTPRQLVILSGKGGTGKTSLAAALATLAEDKVLADCDVDAADLHLVVSPRRRHTEVFMSGKEAKILTSECGACGVCKEYCRFDAIRLENGTEGQAEYVVDPLACEGCGLCARVCAFGAVELTEAERGEWFISETPHGPLVHARLNVGGENSGRLVTLVREEAARLARSSGTPLVVVDGPPGIGCPVIASTTGADLVLVVTEPTISGEHDLERVADLVKGFDIPLAVCINKADLNPEMATHIREVCAARRVHIVGEIDYDSAFVEAQVSGQSIVEHGEGRVTDQLREMWKQLEAMLAEVEDE